ncbi:hypothetical protein MHU86_3132 [Fragilaria crotonensis]|nr:hypothetical protein MHU86_3132 [Fragilaria crotonensis]
MSSSFRRKGRRDDAFGLRGTKPWTGGITLTSVGLRDLDTILGGGQPLGTCLLLDEDRWTRDLALCLIRYWCAEAVSHEQFLLMPYFQDKDSTLASSAPSLLEDEIASTHHYGAASAAQINTLIDSLPRNLHWDKAAGNVVGDDATQTLQVLEEDEEGEDAEEGLKIAWQYRKSIQDERLGHVQSNTSKLTGSNVYCHSFDLNGRLDEQDLNREVINLVDGRCCESQVDCRKRVCGFLLFQTLKSHLKPLPKGKLIRLLLYQAPIDAASIAVPLLLAYIRSEELPVVVMVTIQSWTSQSKASLINLQRVSDVVMQTEGFASRVRYPQPPEFRHLHGLLLMPKVSTVTAATANSGGHFADMTMTKRPLAHVYGLKRDRRKLHVQLLHIPPEDHTSGGGSAGGVRSGAGRPNEQASGCGNSGASSVLDF